MNIDFFILLFLLIISKIESASYADSLEIVAQFNIIQFKKNSNEIINCTNCMPAGIKLNYPKMEQYFVVFLDGSIM